MLRDIRRKVAVASAVALAGSLGAVGQARATNVGCGSVLSTAGATVTLHENLLCTAVDGGITITANNVTLNLNGYTIEGLRSPAVGEGAGVLIQNATGVKVTDSTTTSTAFGSGTITNFDAGVVIRGGSGNTVEKINLVANNGNEVTADGEGVAIWNSSSNVVVDNNITHNGPYAGVGVYEEAGSSSNGNVIGRVSAGASPLNGGNVISDNSQILFNTNQDDGVRLEPGVTNNTVENNTIERNGLDGIAVFFAPTGNFTSGNVIKGNKVNANGFHLLRHRKGDGIRVFGPTTTNNATDNTVQANTVCGNAASGIRVDGGRKWSSGWVGVKNVIKNNVSGSGTAACPFNVKDPASSPTSNFDLYDTNVAINDANFKLPCDSNNWTGNTTGNSYNDPCVTAP